MAQLATVAAFGFADLPTAAMLRVFRDLGCRTCQYYRRPGLAPRPEEARKTAADAGLSFDSIHGVFGAEYDPASPDEGRRAAAIEVYRQEGELALRLGGPRVVVHPTPALPAGTVIEPAQRQARVDPLRRSLADLARIGQQQGVTYLIENLQPASAIGEDPARLALLVRELNHPNLGMCFDTGHAHITGDVAAALAACRDVVRYLHVHDNNGQTDAHLIPGDGTLPWDRLRSEVAALPAETPAMLELFQDEITFRRRLEQGLGARLAHWMACPR